MKRFTAIVQLFAAVCSAFFITNYSYGQDGKSGDYSKVTQVPRDKIDGWLKEEVKQSGGNWDKGRYSFYIGFSTAGFGQDPVPAIAMRRLAFTLMNNTLAVGDKITPVAFEMQVDKFGATIPLTSESSSRAQFVSEVPYTSTTGSRGGHDIERALFQILQKIIPGTETSSTIILLLNKDNASQDPQGLNAPLFGEDNPQLKSLIKQAGYRTKLVRVDFPMKSESNTIRVAITALFPENLTPLLDGPTTPRYPTFPRDTWQPPDDAPTADETLPNKTQFLPMAGQSGQPLHRTGPADAPVEHHGIPWWAWLLLALFVVGVILFMVMGKRTGVQRPLQPVAATVVATKVETLPGSFRITIGPDEQTISPLVKGASWSLSRQIDGVVKLVDTTESAAGAPAPTSARQAPQGKDAPVTNTNPVPNPVPGAPIARFSLAEDRSLHAEAESGAVFAELQGTAAEKCDSRALVIEPGKRILCRVQPPDAAAKTRLEIVYEITAGKGSKV